MPWRALCVTKWPHAQHQTFHQCKVRTTTCPRPHFRSTRRNASSSKNVGVSKGQEHRQSIEYQLDKHFVQIHLSKSWITKKPLHNREVARDEIRRWENASEGPSIRHFRNKSAAEQSRHRKPSTESEEPDNSKDQKELLKSLDDVLRTTRALPDQRRCVDKPSIIRDTHLLSEPRSVTRSESSRQQKRRRPRHLHIKAYSTTAPVPNPKAANDSYPSSALTGEGLNNGHHTLKGGGSIYQRLQRWQDQNHGGSSRGLPNGGLVPESQGSTVNTPFMVEDVEEDNFTQVENDSHEYEPSSPDTAEDALESAASIQLPPTFFQMGDLVELYFGRAFLAIFIQNLGPLHGLFYSEDGAWCVFQVKAPTFSVPKFMGRHVLQDILPFTPPIEPSRRYQSYTYGASILDQSPPIGTGSKALGCMRDFRQASEKLYRQHADRLDAAYELLASKEYSDGAVSRTLHDITRTLFQLSKESEPTAAMLWTVHRNLMRTSNIFTISERHRLSPTFQFFPRRSLKDLQTVVRWMREYQEHIREASLTGDRNQAISHANMRNNPVEAFVQKARSTIIRSRRHRKVAPTGFVGPHLHADLSRMPDSAPNDRAPAIFDDNEEIILQYLRSWATSRTFAKGDPMLSAGPALLKAIGLYEGLDLNESAAYTLLQELGMVSPWECPVPYIARIGLPGFSPLHPVTALQEQTQSLDPNKRMNDAMRTYRKDWGNTPVFCIDNAGTAVRDDGISVEEVPGSDGEVWIHAHVANPTAFVGPKSVHARYAALLTSTVYCPDFQIPMFDSELVEQNFNLANGRPCITFSTKVSQHGSIIDYTISHGVLNNVHYLTRDEVSEHLGLPGTTEVRETLLSVGGNANDSPGTVAHDPIQPLGSKELESLRLLRKVDGYLNRSRGIMSGLEDRELFHRTAFPQISWQTSNQKREGAMSTRQSVHSDPGITVTYLKMEFSNWVHGCVARCMRLAGEVGALWCMERNIPIPYRGFRQYPEPSVDPSETLEQALQDVASSTSQEMLSQRIFHLRQFGQMDWSHIPLDHVMLDKRAYTKTTSPLRRYVDLVVHWQIEAAIRNEGRASKSLGHKKADLPFSHDDMQSICRWIADRDDTLRKVRATANKHWLLAALFRAFYFDEGKLPEKFLVHITEHANSYAMIDWRGDLVQWGFIVKLTDDTEAVRLHDGYRFYDTWEADIAEIDLYARLLTMRPTRLVSRK